MNEILVVVAVVLGTFFMAVASLGVLRFPDFFHRIHPSTKSATLGLFFLLLAVALEVPDAQTITKALLAFAFIALTAPVSAHLLGRAAYRSGVRSDPSADPDEYGPVAERIQRGHEEGAAR